MSEDKKFDVIFHFGELTQWLGQDWKTLFRYETRDILLPKGNVKSFESYKAAIRGKYNTDNIISAAIKSQGWDASGIRVGVIGFSETCIGAAVLLESKEGGALDFVFTCDGIHRIWPSHKAFAKLAAFGTSGNPNIPPTKHCMVITHSETPSGSSAPSTKETAAEIAKYVMAQPVFTEFVDIPELKNAKHDPVSTTCSYSKEKHTYTQVPGDYATKVGELYILGYKNMARSCNDHIYQAKVIAPLVMKHIVVPRWKNNPRTGGTCLVI